MRKQHASTQHNTMAACPICLSNMNVKEEARSWGCPSDHVFHIACENHVRAEALGRGRDAGCPMCRWTPSKKFTLSEPSTDVEVTMIHMTNALRRTQARLRNMNVELLLKIPLVHALAEESSLNGGCSWLPSLLTKDQLLECLNSADHVANKSTYIARNVIEGLETVCLCQRTKSFVDLRNCVVSMLSAAEDVLNTRTYILGELHKLIRDDASEARSRYGLIV